jgi:serine-type D-Ala-D-Ala carboxypeptidase/endopeptidase (penicillin-binding protein 4)
LKQKNKTKHQKRSLNPTLIGLVATIPIHMLNWGNLNAVQAATSQSTVNFTQSVQNRKTVHANNGKATTQSGICDNNLPHKLDAIINAPRFSTAKWGISIESLSSPTTLYSHNPDDLLIPASNIKLLTTSAALQIIDRRPPRDFTTLERWLGVVNRESDNDYADALLQRIGGRNSVVRVLTPLGVSSDGYVQVDGSGLSRGNRAKPSTMVTLLKRMHSDDQNSLFYNSLPIAGVNGTLSYRFLNTPIKGKVHAKTGTLQGVKALSGYLESENYGTLIFSIMVNQSKQSDEVLTRAIDRIVLQTAQVRQCGEVKALSNQLMNQIMENGKIAFQFIDSLSDR